MPFEIQHQPDLGAIGTAARYAGTGMRLERERQFKEREAARREQAREFDEQMDFRYTSLEAQAAEAEKAQQAAAAQQQAAIAASKEQTELARKQARELADMGDTRARDLADQLDTRARELSAQDIAASQKRIESQLATATDANEAKIIGDIGQFISGIEASEAQLQLQLGPAATKARKQAMAEFEKYTSQDSPVKLAEAAHIAAKVMQVYRETNGQATAALTGEEKAQRAGVHWKKSNDGQEYLMIPDGKGGWSGRPTPPPDGAVTPKLEAEQKAKREQAVYDLVGKIKEEVWDARAQAFRKVYYTREDADAMIAARTAPTSQDLRSIDEFQTTYKIEGEARRLGTTPQTLKAIIERAATGDYKAAQLLIDYGFNR